MSSVSDVIIGKSLLLKNQV